MLVVVEEVAVANLALLVVLVVVVEVDPLLEMVHPLLVIPSQAHLVPHLQVDGVMLVDLVIIMAAVVVVPVVRDLKEMILNLQKKVLVV
jgi:hypothetical protein